MLPIVSDEQSYDAVLVTFEREHILAETLRAIIEQTQPPTRLVVVDNAASASCRELVAGFARSAPVIYTAAADNLGPAGGLALGFDTLGRGTRCRWTVFLDDDDPPPSPESIARLMHFGEGEQALDPRIGCVGLVGARFDLRRARITRVPDHDLEGTIDVDHVGGNHLPLYLTAALLDVGVPLPKLFFGFEELELGLRLRRAGWRILVDGSALKARREAEGRLNLDDRPRLRNTRNAGRDYYSLRNLLWISGAYGAPWGARLRLVLLAGILKPLLNLRRERGFARLFLQVRAVRDGLTGRLGHTVALR